MQNFRITVSQTELAKDGVIRHDVRLLKSGNENKLQKLYIDELLSLNCCFFSFKRDFYGDEFRMLVLTFRKL